ncbi:MAG: ankyrin repeat domain-containing protein [Gammaproteobacteria bacterium]|nr:ankyrin repeat domain-containing protein [Gammaproteobacteria bacterium]
MAPPQLELARKRVATLKTGLVNGDADAMARIRATHPDMQFVPDDSFPMASAQWFSNRAVAREVGFNNWIHLTRHIAAGGALPSEGVLAELVAAVERPEPDAVREMLAAYPHLATARIWDVDNPLGDTLLHRADANAPRSAPWENRDQTTDAHIAVAQALIDHGADVNASGGRGDIIGETPVGAAGWAGNLRMVKFLLQHGADPTIVTDDWGFDALTTIAGHRHPDIVEAIIEAGWPVEPRHLVQAGLKDRLASVLDEEPHRLRELVDMGHFDGDAGTLLHVAVNERVTEMVPFLLERGADPNATDSHGRTALQLVRGDAADTMRDGLVAAGAEVGVLEAAVIGDAERLARLLDENPGLANHRRADGMTPLHLAIASGRDALVPLLIERGAEVDAENVAGERPMHVVTGPRQAPVVRMLVDAGAQAPPEAVIGLGMMDELRALVRADPGFVNRVMPVTGRLPVFAAVATNQLAALEFLLASGGKPDQDGFLPGTPIGAVAGLPQDVSASFADALVRAGVDTEVAGWRTPLGHLVTTGHYDAADVLLRYGADIELRNEGGRTPLQDLARPPIEAERNGHFIAQATFLLDRGADVNALTAEGETALDIAVRLGNETFAAFLRERGGEASLD